MYYSATIRPMLWFLLCAMLAPPTESLSVLIYSKTAPYYGRDFEYRHEAIPEATAAIRAIGEREGWIVEATEDASRFNDETLARFDVVVFLLTTGDVLGVKEEAAFERFIRSGKGYVGIHSASDTEHAWPWYGELVGAYFKDHPSVREATYTVEDRSHPASKDLPKRWTRTDEHYNFHTNPRPNVHVLMALDESSYDVGDSAMGRPPDRVVSRLRRRASILHGARSRERLLRRSFGPWPPRRRNRLGGLEGAVGLPSYVIASVLGARRKAVIFSATWSISTPPRLRSSMAK